ncbi:MAG: methylmalonyl Co-A mutase-associated GTPase MeaB [Dehalococcoidia bacterium]|nr:methylmalonyl Co-A mutase-associated GTPase MeaB [Dehalococcoidia bacterium]
MNPESVTADPLANLFNRALNGDRRAISRLFTRIENDGDALRDVMRLAHPHAGNAEVVGITGPPGAGKSTIVDRLVHTARQEGRTVGVLAVDPTSPFSGGSVLGDRIRMRDHYLDPDVFIRSIATRGAHGGLAAVCRAGVNLLDALGKDFVLVETVGVGQTELDIMGVADIVAVVLVPEAGDAVQAMKAGLLEIADIFVVNKADRHGAGQMASAIRAMLSLDPRPIELKPSLLMTQAHRGEGIPELYDEARLRLENMRDGGRLEKRRRQQATDELTRLVTSSLTAEVIRAMSEDQALLEIVDMVRSGEMDAYSAAERIADSLWRRST